MRHCSLLLYRPPRHRVSLPPHACRYTKKTKKKTHHQYTEANFLVIMQTTKRVPSKAVNHGREVEATTHTCRTPRRSLFSFQPTLQKTRNFWFPPSPRRFVPSCLRATCTPRFLRCCRQTSRQKTTLKKRKRTATVVTWFSLVSLPSSHPMHFPWLSHSIHRHATCENIHPPTRPFWHRFPSLSNSTPPQYPEKQHTATAQKLRCSLAAAKHKKHETCTIHTSGPPSPVRV